MSDGTNTEVAESGAGSSQVGSVFISNYPPYSAWRPEEVGEARAALSSAPAPGTPLGLYLHIPFCRLRCKFCYYKVYTDKDSSEIRSYLSALAQEIRILSGMPAIAGRPLRFVYFGGGTPSFISARHLKALVDEAKAAIPWDGAEEVTFECEPGTLTQAKLETIREIGVTRLSLGVENFGDEILRENGRAHLSAEIFRVIPWVRALKFDQLNLDLIAGMVGETWDNWRDTVRKTIDQAPDSVTVYQMELPYNTVYSKDLLEGSGRVPMADWDLRRAWHDYAFAEMEKAGYEISSAYTVVKKGGDCRFVYRDSVWHGCDMLGTGVASFSHVNGVHFQNAGEWGEYVARLGEGSLPLARALRTTPDQRLVRELILQLKMGRLEPEYFDRKFGADIAGRFAPALDHLRSQGMLAPDRGRIALTRAGLLRVDHLLPEFYAPEYRNARYT
jgi:coproporphyrinogen III oxidase-like Fe-S oxidoreductase